jgi:23S rRNA (guanosine2251-2'-O)-methyltransferase
MHSITLLAHNIRSTHNVGSILRTADAFGVCKVIVSGYTPYPHVASDSRLPHIATKNTKDIAKTALGAEKTMNIEVSDDVAESIRRLRAQGVKIIGLEQDEKSITLPTYSLTSDVAVLLGEERFGLTDELRKLCDSIVEIPMSGQKESLNVSIATAICLYQLRYG